MQALNSRGPQAKLRHAITAPPGWVIVVRDLSGIELRLNMWFSNQMDMVELIRKGGDPYIAEAAGQFRIPYDQVNKTQRQYGKVIQLGCGFRMGVDRFRDYAAAGPLGMDPIYLTETEAREAVYGYRRNNPWVKASWEWWDNFAFPMMASKNCNEDYKCIRLEHEAIVLPNEMRLQYPGLTHSDEGWFWGLGNEKHYIHGGVAQENDIQALAGVVIKSHMNAMDDEFDGDAFVVHQVHDEILVLCREIDAPAIDKRMDEIMTAPLWWAPDLPLKTEGGYDVKYSK
jgi:DNA polymerase